MPLFDAQMPRPSKHVLARFLMKSALLAIFAGLLRPSARGLEVIALFAGAGLLNVFLAVAKREKITAPHLTYWDEAGAYIGIAAAVAILAR